MIDPKNITNFNRTEAELQEFLLFCIVVAGKNSHQQASKLDGFLNGQFGWKPIKELSPFGKIRYLDEFLQLDKRLAEVKMGQYTRISKAFREVAQLSSLSTITISELEKVKGIGPKTARFFLMHSRPNQEIATLDTHILKWLASIGVPNVPKATPSGSRYLKLEQVFLSVCKAQGKTPAELDLEIWKNLTKGSFASLAS